MTPATIPKRIWPRERLTLWRGRSGAALAIVCGVPTASHPNPERFRGTGTVFIAWESVDDEYIGYWDSAPDAEPSPLEPMPTTRSIQEAVRWGRERAQRVLVRPESNPGEYYWAGDGETETADTRALKRLSMDE